MIQKLNPNFKIAGLKIIHYPHEGGSKEYDVNYLKDEVERMLRDYKKSVIIDKRKNARKPIEFWVKSGTRIKDNSDVKHLSII